MNLERISNVSIKTQIPLLEALSKIDEDIRRVDEEIALARRGRDTLDDELKSLQTKLVTDKEALTTMEKTRNELNAEVRQMSSQIEKSREKLSRSRNERESVAAQREMEELRKLVRDREDETNKLESLVATARDAISKAEQRAAELTDEIAGKSEGTQRDLTEKEKLRGELGEQRTVAAKALPPVLLRRYDTIRQRRPKAIASTSDGTCQGCHIAVPPMMFQKMLRQEEFEQCPNCRRILYYQPVRTADEGAAG